MPTSLRMRSPKSLLICGGSSKKKRALITCKFTSGTTERNFGSLTRCRATNCTNTQLNTTTSLFFTRMSTDTFYTELAQKITLPFEIEDVDEIEENAETIWIILKNGKVYSLMFIECEAELEQWEHDWQVYPCQFFQHFVYLCVSSFDVWRSTKFTTWIALRG